MDAGTARQIGVEAYTYLYPLILMDFTKAQITNVSKVGEKPMHSPMGTFVHVRSFPPADFKAVVRPNFDTLYSSAFLDLAAEPVVLSVPAAGDNYYLLPMYDMFGEVFASPGSRTTGNDAQVFALVGPGWTGSLPDGLRRIDAPHNVMWIIGRTQASVATYSDVHQFQDGLTLTPLAAWPGAAPEVIGAVDPSVDDVTPPLQQAFALDASEFFPRAAGLLAMYPPHFCDQSIQMRMQQLGIVAGDSFDFQAASPVIRDALTTAVPAAQKRITARQRHLGFPRNGWRILSQNMGSYGQDYLQRACIELAGLGANLPDDAIYPLSFVDGDGQPYDGKHDYVLHFDASSMPPAQAFWSLTLYDDEGFQVPNALDRFAIGDRDDLTFGADRSLDLLIQHDSPGPGAENNWLPAPAGPFNLCLRLYYPSPRALDGTWMPPPVHEAA
jgi:hypothetical protein